MRRILRKIAEDDFAELGDTSTLADPGVVDRPDREPAEPGVAWHGKLYSSCSLSHCLERVGGRGRRKKMSSRTALGTSPQTPIVWNGRVIGDRHQLIHSVIPAKAGNQAALKLS